MKEPSPRSSRLALTGGIVAVLVVGGAGFLLGQKSVDRVPAAATEPTPIVAPVAVPAETPAPRQAMGRGDLIALAAVAADAAASGSPLPAEVRDAAGRGFDLSLPFGCGGPDAVDSNAAMRWRYDDEAKALRLHVAQVAWSSTDWWADTAPPGIEAIEGFWIARPWTASERCPSATQRPVAAGIDPVTLSGQTLAIAQFFGAGGARQGRRDGKPLTAVVRMAPDEVAAEQGFRAHLTGHVANIPGAGATLCRQPGGADQRPICVIGASMDEVTIENIATGKVVATWTVEGPRGPE